MKKSKAIKLVLVTSLLGTGANTFANNADVNRISNSTVFKISKGFAINKHGYFNQPDSTTHHGGSSGFVAPAKRGGWGIFGHHSSASLLN